MGTGTQSFTQNKFPVITNIREILYKELNACQWKSQKTYSLDRITVFIPLSMLLITLGSAGKQWTGWMDACDFFVFRPDLSNAAILDWQLAINLLAVRLDWTSNIPREDPQEKQRYLDSHHKKLLPSEYGILSICLYTNPWTVTVSYNIHMLSFCISFNIY